MDSPLIPSLFPLSQPDDLVALLPLVARVGGFIGSKKFSPTSSSTFIIPGVQRLSQWGLGQETHESAFLSNQGGPIINSQGVKFHK
jgi:hypothetical protein